LACKDKKLTFALHRADVTIRANKPRGCRLAAALLSGEVVAAGAGAFRAASQVLKYSVILTDTSLLYFA
jgi:hypothetical protein